MCVSQADCEQKNRPWIMISAQLVNRLQLQTLHKRRTVSKATSIYPFGIYVQDNESSRAYSSPKSGISLVFALALWTSCQLREGKLTINTTWQPNKLLLPHSRTNTTCTPSSSTPQSSVCDCGTRSPTEYPRSARSRSHGLQFQNGSCDFNWALSGLG